LDLRGGSDISPPETKGIDAVDENYVLEDQIGFLLRLASQRHGTIFQANAIDGITPTQFSALIKISDVGECSQNHLGRLAGMDVATIKGVVDRLGNKGLVKSRPDPEDKRRVLVSLSKEGNALAAEMKKAGQAITADTLEPLSAQEQKTLLKILRKIS